MCAPTHSRLLGSSTLYPGCRVSSSAHSCAAGSSWGTETVSARVPVISALFAKYSTWTCQGEDGCSIAITVFVWHRCYLFVTDTLESEGTLKRRAFVHFDNTGVSSPFSLGSSAGQLCKRPRAPARTRESAAAPNDSSESDTRRPPLTGSAPSMSR